MSKDPSKRRRTILFIVAGCIAVLLVISSSISAYLECRWRQRHAAATDSSRTSSSRTDTSQTSQTDRTTVGGTSLESPKGTSLKFRTVAFGDLDCTFQDGEQIAAIKAGDFIIVEGDVVEQTHQFLKCKLIKNWGKMDLEK
jgi:hypothetical protein